MTDVFHLKVVSNRMTVASVSGNRKTAGNPAKQLSFPFPSPSSIFIFNVDFLTAPDIINALDKAEPRWIFDVRVFPRLDVVAGTRANAFKFFEKMKLTYVDLLGRVGISNYRSADVNPAFWVDDLIEILEFSEQRRGPYILLMDNPALIEATLRTVPEAIERVIGKKVSTTVIAR